MLIRCAQCKNLHLIADHIGIFEDKGGLENSQNKPLICVISVLTVAFYCCSIIIKIGWDISKHLESQSEKGVHFVNNDNVLELSAEDILGAGRKVA